MTFPGLGGQQPPPQNASPAGQLTPGVTPGVTGQIVARRVIIIGDNGELLIYTPTAAAGNLVVSAVALATTDAFGDTVQGGVTSYAGANAWISMNGAQLLINAAASQPIPAIIEETTAGQLSLNSGTVSAGDTQATILLESADAAGGQSLFATDAAIVQINSSAAFAMPFSSAGITSVAQVVAALIDVGVFK